MRNGTTTPTEAIIWVFSIKLRHNSSGGRGRPYPAAFCAGALAQGGFKRSAEGGQGGAEMEMELGAQKARRPVSPV